MENKTAEEMFEELGFKKIVYTNSNFFGHDMVYKDEFYNEIKFVDKIVFNMAVTLTNKHIKAIHKQMEELGWL